jgi:Thiolase, N-terminal domain/Aldehyde dehydrogenase family
MPETFIVDAVRTPVTRRGGGLAGAHPADLGAHVIKELVARTHIDPGAVDDVVFGCVDTVGPQAGDVARTAWLAAGLPEAVPGVTVDRQCGSSQQGGDHLVLTLREPAGVAGVNGFQLEPNWPFGGFRQSGLGREGGRAAIESYTELKTVLLPFTDEMM